MRVLVVDDSAFARKVLRDTLAAERDVDVVGFARDGLEALEKIRELRPDVVTLDLALPELDGLGVLRAMSGWSDRPRVVVVTADDVARLGVAALTAGAFDVVRKPSAVANDRLYEVGGRVVSAVRAAAAGRAPGSKPPDFEGSAPAFDLVVVGASTGGPQAVATLLSGLPSDLPAAVAVVLHMPLGYTTAYADRVARDCALEVSEASDDFELSAGRVAIARAGLHLKIAVAGGGLRARLDAHPLDTPHRPSVDVLFESAARARGRRVLAVVLTGMGDDGLAGARAVRASGGRVLAQAASSCVVYGMPRAVVESGLADEVVDLDRAAAAVIAAVNGGGAGGGAPGRAEP